MSITLEQLNELLDDGNTGLHVSLEPDTILYRVWDGLSKDHYQTIAYVPTIEDALECVLGLCKLVRKTG